jgi:lactoylglutathione lyase
MKLYHITALFYLPFALSCGPPPQSNTTLPYNYTSGNDGPADPATKGYFINHIGMLTSDLNRTSEWYKTVLGMREVFTMELSPEYTVMYMAHSQGGRNGTGFQTGEEMGLEKNNMAGMIEFQLYTVSSLPVTSCSSGW